MKNLPAASSMTEEAMLLQPEGPINGEARMLQGDILAARQDPAGAAKAYMTVAVLNQGDDLLARRAFSRAADAYRKAGDAEAAAKALGELHNRDGHAPVSPTPAP
jgi:hypothetical protein